MGRLEDETRDALVDDDLSQPVFRRDLIENWKRERARQGLFFLASTVLIAAAFLAVVLFLR